MAKITYKPRSRPLLTSLREMIGRINTNIGNWRNYFTWQLYGSAPSTDSSKADYTLTQALFYACEIKDPVTNVSRGKEYRLGAGFAKPIVNATAAFTIGKLPEVRSSDETNADALTEINGWLEDNKGKLLIWARNGYRDGDAYLRIKEEDLTLSLIAPHKVDKVFDEINGNLLGYNITSYIKDDKGNNVKYVEEVRKTFPYSVIKKYKNDKDYTEIYTSPEEMRVADEERPLPIIHLANEKEADQIYGYSDYQNLFHYFLNYHAVLENGIKNNIYNSNAVPVIEGLENVNQFLEANGTKNSDGTISFNWDPNKVLVGGKGMNAKILAGVTNASEVQTMLNLIFWIICQASETPEFVFGTAVQSSKASVSEQMPVMVKKAERKQTMLTESLKELIDVYLYFASILDSAIPVELEYEIKWFPILDKDLRLNLDIAQALKQMGVITNKTVSMMTGVADYVDDVDKELEAAKGERDSEKQQEITEFKQMNQPFAESKNNQ